MKESKNNSEEKINSTKKTPASKRNTKAKRKTTSSSSKTPVKRKSSTRKRVSKKRKEIVLGISSVSKLKPLSFNRSLEVYTSMITVPEVSSFFDSRELCDFSSFEGCCSIGMFFIHINEALKGDQLHNFFYWIAKSTFPTLVSFGVTSKTPSVVFSDPLQRYNFFKFCCCVGLGFLGNPYKDDNLDIIFDDVTSKRLLEFEIGKKKGKR